MLVLTNILERLIRVFAGGGKTSDTVIPIVKITIPIAPRKSNDNTLLLRRPVDVKFKMSSPFGWRIDPLDSSKKEFHKGIDFAVPEGTPIQAMASGQIFRAGWENEEDAKQGFGLRVWQESAVEGQRYYFWYGHMSKLSVKSGQFIKEGDLLGLSGNTGHTSGPHIHVQARQINTDKLMNMEFYV